MRFLDRKRDMELLIAYVKGWDVEPDVVIIGVYSTYELADKAGQANLHTIKDGVSYVETVELNHIPSYLEET